MRFSKFVVALVIILNSLFAAAVLLVFAKTSSEPTALIAAWFAWTTGELWMLSKIKRAKLKGGDDGASEENPDDSN
jgi:hypothetical protein